MHSNQRGHRWPAQLDDGWQPNVPIVEGMRLRFPAGMREPAFDSRLASLLFDAAQNYGLVVDDRAGWDVAVRVEPLTNSVSSPQCDALLDGVDPHHALDAFPWARLQLLAVGSDRLPNPPALRAELPRVQPVDRGLAGAAVPPAGAIAIGRAGVAARSRNPAPISVTVVRRPSGTLVWAGRAEPGRRMRLTLPGGRLGVSLGRRGASVRLRIRSDALLAGLERSCGCRASRAARGRRAAPPSRPSGADASCA